MFSPSEFLSIFTWWAVFFILGGIFFPLTNTLFKGFSDHGYLFSKVIGAGIISYALLVLNVLHILPFGLISILLIVWIFAIVNALFFKKRNKKNKIEFKIILFEEALFLIGIFIWSFIRAHEPSLNGLEKFMDYGFVNSILRTTYQPAVDMWFPPNPINYYYFGHLTTAVLTKLSFLPSNITYNLMIATLFSFCFTLSFSLGINLIGKTFLSKKTIIGGLLTGALVTLAGNLHTIYAFFKPYNVDKPVPFWNLTFLFNSFPNSYWYPNATRFIPFTIHEFPLYSFVVSDLHGHVVDIMYVLLMIAFSYVLLTNKTISKLLLIMMSLFLAIMYMTNVWDGLIYILLISLVLIIKNWNRKNLRQTILDSGRTVVKIAVMFFIFALPFNIFFKPFASGIGVLCAPTFLTNMGKIGPFLFEANHCQKSQWWELLTLYGFFYFFVISFLVFIKIHKPKIKLELQDLFVLTLIVVSTILIIIPEFIYVKDIYPQHYRANTMFKLVYQSFIMMSISSGYIIIRIIGNFKSVNLKSKGMVQNLSRLLFCLMTILLLSLIFIYPYFAIKSYYGDLKVYSGLDGLTYLKTKYPDDYGVINFINANIPGRPIIAEAQGDSYTDYARISANTGLPTILGWTVHEWLWRGSYDIPAPRIKEVQDLYESQDLTLTKYILNKYKVEYVYIGSLEHQKYPNLYEAKFGKLGKIIWQQGESKLYKMN